MEHAHRDFEESKEIVGRGEDAAGELGIVVGEGIGDDEVALALDGHPIRQLVVVSVGIVEETAFFDEQSAGVHTRPGAAVPTRRRRAQQLLDRLHRHPDVVALLLFVESIVLDPTPAMAADVEPCVKNRRGHRRIAFERERARERGCRQLALAKKPEHPPHANAASVLEHRLSGEIALAVRNRRHRAFR